MKRIWVILLLLTGVAHGQTSLGTVTGTIADASRGIIVGARVLLTHTETGVRRSMNSNEAGIYRFEAVELGVYQIEVTQPGFRPSLITMVRVDANRTTTIDARLEVGVTVTSIEVNVEAAEQLVKDSPLRGGNFLSREVRDLPLISLNPLSLAGTLPGVLQPTGSWTWQREGEATEFSVNGQRIRGNNYLLDGAENNDIAFGGPAQVVHIADAVEAVAVQTGNFGVEFGRAGGGIFNVVTKSGTNTVRGSVLWRHQSQRFNSVSNVNRLNGETETPFRRHVFGFTVGGPVRKNRTFFFAAFQQDTRRTDSFQGLTVPTASAVSHLRSLFPAGANPRLDLYLRFLGDVRGSDIAAPIIQDLGTDPATGVARGSIAFARASIPMPSLEEDPQWIGRLDHQVSEKHRLSGRYSYDFFLRSPNSVSFPGFFNERRWRNQNWLFVDNYVFGPSHTNEFRFSFGRTDASPDQVSPLVAPEAREVPNVMLGNSGISTPGLSGFGQYRKANSFLLQETQTKLTGRHTFRYGAEFLRQLAVQLPPANHVGIVGYGANPVSAFANFLDDFSGQAGRLRKELGSVEFHPNQFRHSYFFQDTWKARPSLSVVLGLRYENFGQPANTLKYAAFAGFDPDQFLTPSRVNVDNNNFGPAIGLAWSPSLNSGLMGKLFGDGKTVWRAGFQVSYDGFFTQMVALGPSTSTPNASSFDFTATEPGRGLANWSQRLPMATPASPSTLDSQDGMPERDLRSPYTERWSLSVQRQLPGNVVIEGAYVGTVSHKLATRTDVNPIVGAGAARLHPNFGQRWIRTSQGNSAYHAMQWRAERRFARGFQVGSSYTWSKNFDSTSEGIGNVNTQYTNMNLTSVPVMFGGLKLDRGLSDFHRSHRFAFSYLWQLPGPPAAIWKHVFGGWSLAGIASFQSGAPYTMLNGFDRNGDGVPNDRPDISNPNAPLNTRAILVPTSVCSTGYRNPDTESNVTLCVTPADVHWIEGRGLPNATTVGRNTLFAGWVNNMDLSLLKSFSVGEQRRLELRWEAFNVFNHPQFTQVPVPAARNVLTAQGPAQGFPSRFLNQDFTNSGIRSMWVQVKLLF